MVEVDINRTVTTGLIDGAYATVGGGIGYFAADTASGVVGADSMAMRIGVDIAIGVGIVIFAQAADLDGHAAKIAGMASAGAFAAAVTEPFN